MKLNQSVKFARNSVWLEVMASVLAGHSCLHDPNNKQRHFKGVTLNLLARKIAWSPVPAEIKLI
jgi:hypothetical protein